MTDPATRDSRNIGASLIPPGIADERSRAFLKIVQRGAALFDFRKLLMRNSSEMSDEVLELAVHDLSLGEYIPSAGVPRTVARRLIDQAWLLHESQGTEGGIDLGLAQLDMVVHLRPWNRIEPKGPHDTFEATIFADRDVYGDGSALTRIARDAGATMFRATQRHSQAGPITFGVRHRTKVRSGGLSRMSGAMRSPVLAPGDQLFTSQPRVAATGRLGGLIHTRLAITDQRTAARQRVIAIGRMSGILHTRGLEA